MGTSDSHQTSRIEGDAEDDMISIGSVLAKSIARSGGQVYTFWASPPEVRGGRSTFQYPAGPRPVGPPGDKVDPLVRSVDCRGRFCVDLLVNM